MAQGPEGPTRLPRWLRTWWRKVRWWWQDGTSRRQGAAATDTTDVARADDAPPEAKPSATEPDGGKAVNWELIGQVVAFVAGLAAWVALVGGARLWARLVSADIPALPALTSLDEGDLVVEGFHTLLVPVLLGGVVALVVHLSRPRDDDKPPAETPPPPCPSPLDTPHVWMMWTPGPNAGALVPVPDSSPPGTPPSGSESQGLTDTPAPQPPGRSATVQTAARQHRRSATLGGTVLGVLILFVTLGLADARWDILAASVLVGLILLAVGLGKRSDALSVIGTLCVAAGLLWSLLAAVEPWTLLVMLLTTIGAVWIALRAIARQPVGRAALSLFVAVVAWSGAIGFAQERGDLTPDLFPASVWFMDGPPMYGYFLGISSSDHLMLAQPIEESRSRIVVHLPLAGIERFAYGQAHAVPPLSDREPTGTPTEVPTPTPTFGPTEHPEYPQEPPRRRPPDDPTTPAPPFERARTLVEKDAQLGLTEARLHVLSLARRSNGYLQLEVRLENLSPQTLAIDSTFGRGPGDFSIAGIEVLDAVNDQQYGVAYTRDGCVCDKGLDQVEVPGHGSWHLAAGFKVPDSLSPRVDLHVPGFGWIPGVEVT